MGSTGVGKGAEWASGTMPAEPVILPVPDCSRCSWAVVSASPFLVRLKLLASTCRVHQAIDRRSWDCQHYLATMTLRPTVPASGYVPLLEIERPRVPLVPRLCIVCGSRRVLPGWQRCGPCIGVMNGRQAMATA